MSMKLFWFLFSFVLFTTNQFTHEDVHLDIKSLSWKKINRKIQTKSILNPLEAYALARYHEEAPSKDPSKKIKLLYSILTLEYPLEISSKEIEKLLASQIQLNKVIARVSFWKLYNELSNKKLLNLSQKIEFLKKMPLELDPISVAVFIEILKLHKQGGNFDEVQKLIDNLTDYQKSYLYTPSVKLIYAENLAELKKLEQAYKLIFQILQNSQDGETKRKAFNLLFKLYGESIYKDLSPDELAVAYPYFHKDIKKKILSNYLDAEKEFQRKDSVKKTANYISIKLPSQIMYFLRKQQHHLKGEDEFFCSISENLINSKDYKRAYAVIDEFLKESPKYCKFKSLARIYDKWNEKEKFFYNVVRYLALNPYDLIYQDKLIDFLAETRPGSIVYAQNKYWEIALSEMPNLPVKGRLVYWYLRFLKYTNQEEKMKNILNNFYSLCPGSYYILVIQDEFQKEIEGLEKPQNPLTNLDSLMKYLSLVKYEEAVNNLVGKNLSFAYYKNSQELTERLSKIKNFILTNPILSLAVEYLKIGEYKYGMYLADYYINKNKLSDQERYEIYVGLGDESSYTYLYMFYTRLLMKLYQIPDNPLLLPMYITSRLYPRPYRDLVKAGEKEFGVEEEIIYAIMRQESFFRETARSPANARGLMQVMPATGRFLASKLKVSDYSLHDPEVSIRFGAKFLADLLKNYEGKLTWAAIAYNGGPGNLRKWKRNHYRGDFNHFLEELPSKESRDYCRIIISNYMNYKTLKKLEGLD